MEIKNIAPPILVLIAFLGIWSIGAMIYDMVFLLPGPMTVASAFVEDFSIILQGATITLREALTGYLLAISIGISVATVMSLSKIMERSLYPYAILLQTVPVVAVAVDVTPVIVSFVINSLPFVTIYVIGLVVFTTTAFAPLDAPWIVSPF